jgi:hypothetical protein
MGDRGRYAPGHRHVWEPACGSGKMATVLRDAERAMALVYLEDWLNSHRD